MSVLEDVFDTGLIEYWEDLQEEFNAEMRRAKVNITRFKSVRVIGTSDDHLGSDMEMAARIHCQLADVVTRVESGHQFDSKRFDDMLVVFSIAIHALSCDNDALDSAFAIGIGSLFVMLPWAILKKKATTLRASLENLDKLLRQAKREQIESYGQTIVNLAIAGVTVATGPTSLLIIGGVAIGQMVLDNAIGANTSASATWGSRSATTSGAVSSVIENAEQIGTTGKSVAKTAGKATIVVGFAFDVNEIHTAHVNVANLEKAITKAKRDLEDLQAEIKRHRPKISAFVAGLKAWEKYMTQLDESVVDVRDDLDNMMQSTGYYP